MSSLVGLLNRIFDICNPKGGGLITKHLYFKQISFLFLAFFSATLWTTPAAAEFSIEYQAPEDPATQRFSAFVGVPPAPLVTEAIADDLGYPAWSISGLALNSQFAYRTGPLNADQKEDIRSQGFTLTLRGRVLRGSAPAYDAGNNTVIGGASLDIGTKRYDLYLGINRSGNTVVVLTTSLDASGPGGSIRTSGPSYTLNDAGYHTYDLVFNPSTQSASLFVDGMERISGYTGHRLFLTDRGLQFNAASGGGINVNFVRLTSPAVVPVACNGLTGEALQTCSSYEFSLEQGTQKTDFIQLINTGTVPRTATLEVINPHSDLAASLLQSTVSIAAGETQTLPIILDASATQGVYDDLLLKVTADGGSTVYASLKVYVTPTGAGQLPDLAITANDIRSTTNPDGTVTLTADIRNQGLTSAANVQVQFYEFGNALGSPVAIDSIAPKGSGSASITIPALADGDHLIRVVVDPAGAIAELDETNNEASRLIPIGSPNPRAGNILVTGSLPATVYTDSLFTLNGRAVYDLYVNGVRYTDYVVRGGSVQITLKAEDGAEWVYGDVYTDVNGNFSKAIQAPATPGIYRIIMTVTDKTFVGTRELDCIATEPPPPGALPPLQSPPAEWGTGYFEWDGVASQWVWTWTNLLLTGPMPQQDVFVYSKDLYFSKNNPSAGEEITVFAAIRYWASSSALIAQNVPINVYATYPGEPKVMIGQTLLKSLSVGSPDFGARYVYATWKNPGDGVYLIEFEIDPSYAEANKLNNAATRAIIAGQISGIPQGVIAGQVTAPLGGLGGVTIEVLDATGQPIGNAITDTTGFYHVDNVPAGAAQVRIVAPSGYVPDAETKTTTVTNQAVSTVNFGLTTQPADTTPPDIQANIDPPQSQNGWYRSNVTVSWTVTDPESPITFTDGCQATTVTTDTAGVTFTCSATSGGGTAFQSVTVKRDATPPTITGSVRPSANANGWLSSPATVTFACTDATSGIAACASDQTLANEGAKQSASGTTTDNAGNSANTSVTGINIDRTAPEVAITGVANGAIYTVGSVPTAECPTTDALSGVQSDATPNVSGGNPDGTGTFTVSCTGAMDKADNPGAAPSVTYQVNPAPPVYNFPATTVLDNFGRADSALGSNWSGSAGTAAYRVAGQQVDVRNGGPVYWKPTSFGVNQEAFVTLTTIDPTGVDQDLLLKVQGTNGNYQKGVIEVLYDATAKVPGVKVETSRDGATWKIYSKIPVTFQNGDQMGARVYATGKVEVYKNRVLVGSTTLNAADQTFFNAKGGRIGLWFANAPNAMVDNFGGGSIAP